MRWLGPLLLLSVGACASLQRAPGGLTAAARILAVDVAAQRGGRDGALACLAMLLRYHGRDLDGEALERFGPARAPDGALSPGELRDYLRGRGFRAEVRRGELSFDALRGVLASVREGRPVLVLAASASGPRWLLLHGYDARPRWVMVVDPIAGPRILDWDELDEAWRSSGRVTLVAAPGAFAPLASSVVAGR